MGPLAPMTAPVAAPGFSPAIVPVPQGADPAPAYADPRLSQSGQVREEYRKSGEWIK